MKYDPELNRGNMQMADRAKAEYHYLKYLEDVNDSFQKARVYCQLGALYAVTFNRAKGEEPNDAKAAMYYRKVLEFEPERLDRPTIVARNMLVSLDHPPGMERIKADMALYEWLCSWDQEKITKQSLPLRKPGPVRKIPIREFKDANGVVTGGVYRQEGGTGERTESDVRATLNKLADYREASVYNAACAAAASDNPEEGFKYIREHLPPGAPEIKTLDEVVQQRAQRMIDDVARQVLNSFSADLHRPVASVEDANGVVNRSADMEQIAAKLNVLRRSIPHLESARRQRMPFILHLKSGEKVGVGAQDVTETQVYEQLAKAEKGDLAWDGRFLAPRGVKLFSARQEAARPLRHSRCRYGDAYELPKDVRLPYTFVAADKEGSCYLVKVSRTLPESVEVFYRGLSPAEVSAYLPVKEKD